MPDSVSGRLFEAGSSRNAPAALGRDGGSLVLRTDAGAERLPPEGVASVSPALGRTPRRVALADGRVFETKDTDGIDRLFPKARGVLSGARGWTLGALAAATVAIMAATIVFVLPLAASLAAALTPSPVRSLIDSSALSTLRTIGLVEEGEGDPQDLEPQFGEMLRAAGEDPSDYRLIVVEAPRIGPNAFAMPGGTLVVTTDLIELLGRDELVLAVLAHEVGHVTGDHGLQLLYRALGLRAVIDGLTGGAGAGVDVVAENAGALLTLQNTRGFERDADAAAVDLLRRAGRRPEALAEALSLIREDCRACGEDSILSTHPGMEERIEAIRRLAAAPGEDQTAR